MDFISVPTAPPSDKNVQLPIYNEASDFPGESDKYRQLYTGKLCTPGGIVQNIVVQLITKTIFGEIIGFTYCFLDFFVYFYLLAYNLVFSFVM